jgi:hypothetical protein
MDRTMMQIDPATLPLRRVGRLSRRRLRIDGAQLRNGTHSDGRLTVEISGLGSAGAGEPDTFHWTADRPIALVIVRAGQDGDVSFEVGPTTAGTAANVRLGNRAGGGVGNRYITFCYDAEPEAISVPIPARRLA